jgi:GTP-binding protein
MEIKKSDFVTSCVAANRYPEFLGVEFAFVGKSNVGKSSLINTLTGRRTLAKTSKTPGKTQLINYFIINSSFYFVDLPGYGFAKVPEQVKRDWGKIIEEYLKSERKKLVFVLLDIRRIPSQDDLEMIEWLKHYGIDYKIIFTKVDKFSNNERIKQLKEIKKKIDIDGERAMFFSSLTKYGKSEVLEFIGNYIQTGGSEVGRDE